MKKSRTIFIMLLLMLFGLLPQSGFADANVHFQMMKDKHLEFINISEHMLTVHGTGGIAHDYAGYSADGNPANDRSGQTYGGFILNPGERMVVTPSVNDENKDFYFPSEWLNKVIQVNETQASSVYRIAALKNDSLEFTNASESYLTVHGTGGIAHEYAGYSADGNPANDRSGQTYGGFILNPGERMVVTPSVSDEHKEFYFPAEWLNKVLLCKNLGTGETYAQVGITRVSDAIEERQHEDEWSGTNNSENISQRSSRGLQPHAGSATDPLTEASEDTLSKTSQVTATTILATPLVCDDVWGASYSREHTNKVDMFYGSYDYTDIEYYPGVCDTEGICTAKKHQKKGHATEGISVCAVEDGTIKENGAKSPTGKIVIEHTTSLVTEQNRTNGGHPSWTSTYLHIIPREDLVNGQAVKAGEVIGEVAPYGQKGANHGAHLHFELRDQNKRLISPAAVRFSLPIHWTENAKKYIDGLK